MKLKAFLFAFITLTGCARQPQPAQLASDHQDDPTYYVPAAKLALLGDTVKVVDQYDSGVVVQSLNNDFDSIKTLVPESFRVDQFEREFTKYSFTSMEAKLKELAAKYPALAKLDIYATSTRGRPQYFLTLSDPANPEPKPELMITGATHGNETATVDVVLGLAEVFLSESATNERVAAMLRSNTIHFVPAVCVDSYVAQTRQAEGVDPNRDYPYPNNPNRQSVKCISDIMSFVASHNIDGTLDYHSAASMVFFPWAYTYSPIPEPDYTKHNDLTTSMAENNGFEHGQIAQTIYVAPGSSADYYYWKHHAVATAIELSHNMAVANTDTDELVEEVTESTYRFVEGIR